MKTTRSVMSAMLILLLLFGVRVASQAQSLTLTSLNPSSVQAGSFTMTLTGTGFTPTCTATVILSIINYPNLTTTTYVSPTQLTVSGGAAANSNPYYVYVHDTATNKTSNTLYLTVYPAPIDFGLYPDHVMAGSGSFTLDAVNDHQAPVFISWLFNGVTTGFSGFVKSPSTTAFNIPASTITTPGVATISGGNYGGGGYISVPFYITGNATVTSLSPNTASAGDRDFTLTINGTGFAPGDQAQWNGIALQTSFLSPTQLLALVPASLVRTTGTAQITAAYAYPVSFSIPTVHVSGKVALQGETQPAQNVTLEFRPATGAATVIATRLAADGSFDTGGIKPGAYNLAAKGYKWLRSVTPITAGATPLSGVQLSLLGGDANGDNTVDTADFNLFVLSYGGSVSVPGSGYDLRADFNDDGVIDIADFDVLVLAFGNTGAL